LKKKKKDFLTFFWKKESKTKKTSMRKDAAPAAGSRAANGLTAIGKNS